MRIEWIIKKGVDRVVVFFNGWGMDKMAVSHINSDMDVLMLYDYRTLTPIHFPDMGAYREIHVVAWSMGVWAAANVIPEWNIAPANLIALNGTEHPVDDNWGIPSRIYRLTEKGMNEQGRTKFMQRMLSGEEDIQRFEKNKPLRGVDDVCEELAMIRKQSTGLQNEVQWNRVYVSAEDVIFPVQNQMNWWQNRNIQYQTITGGHYPFYHFQKWEDLVKS